MVISVWISLWHLNLSLMVAMVTRAATPSSLHLESSWEKVEWEGQKAFVSYQFHFKDLSWKPYAKAFAYAWLSRARLMTTSSCKGEWEMQGGGFFFLFFFFLQFFCFVFPKYIRAHNQIGGVGRVRGYWVVSSQFSYSACQIPESESCWSLTVDSEMIPRLMVPGHLWEAPGEA